MTKRISSVLLTVVTLFSAGAQNTFGTASTHVWAPSTDVQAFNVRHITCDLYLPTETDASGNRVATVTNLGLTVGVLPCKKINMEVGFDHKSGLGSLDSYPLYLNAKLGIPEQTFGKLFPAVAAGILDVGTKKDATDYNVIYGKVAKTITVGKTSLGRLSLGYFTGNKKLLLDDKGEKDNSGVMAAWERTMTEISDKLWLCVDYMGTKSVYGCVNVGAAWKFSTNVALIGGYDIYNNDALASTVTIQVDIDF